ncbi:MAG TPA: DUF3006 domain-containing protein [Candidatus Rifleibacterium sp.]|nr:DUF3006 domain-containing protein [Candidatus Rifleibacterium sp.]
MHAVVDSFNGGYLLENGDVINVHKTCFSAAIEVGDVVTVSFQRDEAASKKQKDLMK